LPTRSWLPSWCAFAFEALASQTDRIVNAQENVVPLRAAQVTS